MAKKLSAEQRLKLIRKITDLADGITHEYVNEMNKKISGPEIDAKEKLKVFSEIDKVLRISKQYSDRELLAEGKTTANIGIDGKGTPPFKVIFTETIEAPASPDQVTGEKCESDKTKESIDA